MSTHELALIEELDIRIAKLQMELENAKAELSIAHEDNRKLQQAYDKLMIKYEKAADDFNHYYRQDL